MSLTDLHPGIDRRLRQSEAERATAARDEHARARLIRFIETVIKKTGCGHRYKLRIGDRTIGYDCLTLEALENLAEEVRSDFWWTRKINRRSRAIYAARQSNAVRQLQAAE